MSSVWTKERVHNLINRLLGCSEPTIRKRNSLHMFFELFKCIQPGIKKRIKHERREKQKKIQYNAWHITTQIPERTFLLYLYQNRKKSYLNVKNLLDLSVFCWAHTQSNHMLNAECQYSKYYKIVSLSHCWIPFIPFLPNIWYIVWILDIVLGCAREAHVLIN